MRRYLLTMAALCGLVVVCSGQNIATYHNQDIENSAIYLSGNPYQRDMLLYVDMLTSTHPYYADQKHCTKLDKQTRRMYKECGKIDSDLDFKIYLAKIAASLNDGHTSVPFWGGFDKIFPVKFILDGGSLAVIEISPEDRRDLLGKEVESINGKPIWQILKTARPLVSADNDANYENTIKELLMFAQFWPLIGMSDEVMQLTFTDGTNVEISAVDRGNLRIAQLQKSETAKVTAQRGVLFDYTIFEDESICYLQFNQFADRLTYPNYPQLARFDEFTCNMMADIEAKGIETLVVDLQYNGGGNSQLGDVLLSWLYPHRETKHYGVDVRVSELVYTYYPYYRNFTVGGEYLKIGRLYDYMGFDHSKEYEVDYNAVQDPNKHLFNFDDEHIYDGNIIFVQGKNSFSSATLLLTMARDNGIGIIIGEPSGGKPSHYGDVLYCMLPNTGAIATVSHKHFVRPNIEATDCDCIMPDVMVELNNPDSDLVWEWIVEHYGKANGRAY